MFDSAPDAEPGEPEGRTLLFFGLIRGYKGLDVLIRALPAIVAGAPGTRLVVAGHPFEPVEPLQALASELGVADAVDWRLGYVPDADVPALFASSTVVVCPYRELDSSGVLATALGHGRPAVVSDVGSLGTIVREFEAGRVVAPEDPDALAAACVELLTVGGRARLRGGGRAQGPRHPHLGRRRRRARAALRNRPRGARMKRRPVQARVKRVLDPLLSALLLILLSPVFLVVTLVVLIGSGRPIFFVRPRAGRDGKPFRMIKFRTMVPDAIALGQELNLSEDPFGLVENDPRMTRGGRFLRRTGLDEIPQLVNVLLGQMSLVGPRPDLVEQAAHYTEEERRRLVVRPGDHRLVADPRARGHDLDGALPLRRLVPRALVALARPAHRRAHVRPALPLRAGSGPGRAEHRARPGKPEEPKA